MDSKPIKPDILRVLHACTRDAAARDALARIVDVYLATKERADRAEAELAKLKAEIHAAVQAAPPVLVTLADIGDSDDD